MHISTVMNRRHFFGLFAVVPPAVEAAAAHRVGFAIGTYGLKTLETVEALKVISQLGYDGVSLALMQGWKCDPATLTDSERRSIRIALTDLNLAVAAVNDQLPLIGSPEKRAWNLERIKLAAAFVHGIGGDRLVCLDTMLGLRTSDWDTAKARMADELHEWARVAETHDLTIGVKPHAGQALDTPEKAIWMLNQIGSSRVRLVYDYSHMRVGGFELEQSLRQLVPYTSFISVKDSTGGPADFEFLLPGRGDTDYARYFRLLRELDYRGFVSVEVSAMVQRKPGYDGISAARACYDKLAPYFCRAGLFRVNAKC